MSPRARRSRITNWRADMACFRRGIAVCGGLALAGAVLGAQSDKTLTAWTASVAATEARVARELAAGQPFLAFEAIKSGPNDRRDVLAGKIVLRSLDTRDAQGREIDVPDGRVHHWVG